MTNIVSRSFASRVLTCAVLLLLALPACKKIIAKAGARAARSTSGEPSGETRSGPTAPADSADEAEGEKLSAAIECLNRHSGKVYEARDKYLQGVDAHRLGPRQEARPAGALRDRRLRA